MKKIEIFDPAMCCGTGVCGVDVDQQLVTFATDVDWAKQQGARIERFNLSQQPMAFVNNVVVKGFLDRSGQEALPLILVDGEVALAGRYPQRVELAHWLGIAHVKEVVRQKYGDAATRVAQGGANGGCGSNDPITSNLYNALQAGEVPEKALLASLGCGNPTVLAELKVGETVLDLGSGGGIDVLLSAKRVGPTGMAFGLDMTDPMLALAEENKRKSGLINVQFLKGEIEHIPLPDNSVDVIISNCVINLSADKDRVLAEAFRVLKPSGRFAVSDVVVRGEVPPAIRKSMELWVGCVAGALSDRDYLTKLVAAGFENADIEVMRVYSVDDARDFLSGQDTDLQWLAQQVDGKFVSGFIRAMKPAVLRNGNATAKTPSGGCCGGGSRAC